MKRIPTAFGVALVAGLTLLSGVIHGRLSHRWGPARDSLEAAKKLKDFPAQFGDWQLASSEEMGPDVVEMLQCTGYFSRTYVHQKSGETVRVAVILGPPGQISVHTPEICYSSVDHSIIDSRSAVAIPTAPETQEEFWRVTFQRNDLSAEMFRVYYAWSPGDRWTASDNPRFAFAGYPYLYKIQLAVPLPPGSDPQAEDAGQRFLRDFVPAAKDYLIPCERDGEG